MSTETGTTLGGPDDLTERERTAVEALLRGMADDEFVLAERYIEWQVESPTLESDLSIANIAQDEYGHARLWYDLLEDFGAEEEDLIWEADPADFRHATFVELPFAEGDWADAIVRGYLFDVHERNLLGALSGSQYPRIADRVEKIRREEEYHLEHGRSWLEHLCDDAPGRERVQDALDRLFPYALTLFEPTSEEDAIVDLGLRTASVDDLRGQWLDEVVPYLESLGLRVPVDDVPIDDGAVLVDLPDRRGRNGDHTEHWPELFEEFTFTYHDLDYARPPHLMEDPDDVE
jgi:ring-1,2-phenylacetyl-CoA epoxidase subunit PaaC